MQAQAHSCADEDGVWDSFQSELQGSGGDGRVLSFTTPPKAAKMCIVCSSSPVFQNSDESGCDWCETCILGMTSSSQECEQQSSLTPLKDTAALKDDAENDSDCEHMPEREVKTVSSQIVGLDQEKTLPNSFNRRRIWGTGNNGTDISAPKKLASLVEVTAVKPSHV
jgi:hypothetical protein